MNNGMKISEFSRLSQVPAKTLRYYDQIGLLSPANVDPFTSYRYYQATQLPRLRRIMLLKGMGFSLAEIGRILQDNLTTTQLIQLVRLKQADLDEQIAQQQARRRDLAKWLKRLELEQKMSDYTVTTKQLDATPIAFVRNTVPSQPELGTYLSDMFQKAVGYAASAGAMNGVTLAVYHDEEWTGKDIDVTAAAVLTKQIAESDGVSVCELPAVEVAYATHVGTFELLSNVYDIVIQWIEANGYKIVDAPREVYVKCTPDMKPEEYVTEIQFPVTK